MRKDAIVIGYASLLLVIAGLFQQLIEWLNKEGALSDRNL
jgi:hypothetical protein